jgi:hypothetical protein
MDELDLKYEEKYAIRSRLIWLLFYSGSSCFRGTLPNVLVGKIVWSHFLIKKSQSRFRNGFDVDSCGEAHAQTHP